MFVLVYLSFGSSAALKLLFFGVFVCLCFSSCVELLGNYDASEVAVAQLVMKQGGKHLRVGWITDPTKTRRAAGLQATIAAAVVCLSLPTLKSQHKKEIRSTFFSPFHALTFVLPPLFLCA